MVVEMSVRRILLGIALALAPVCAFAKLRLLVTHTPPDEKLAALLGVAEQDFRVKAEGAGLIVSESEIAIIARPKNLYNLEYMRQAMDSFNVLRSMASSGQLYKRFSELTSGERKNVRALFSDSSLIEDYGPNILDDSTIFQLERKATITLTNGRKDVTIRLPERQGSQPKDFVRDAPDPAKLKDFREKVLPKIRKTNYPDALVFTFAPSDLISGARTTAIGEYAAELTETLEGQRKAFVAARVALESAMMGDKVPDQGASWLTLDDDTQRMINLMRTDNFAALGFDSKDAADAFFFDARIKAVTINPYVGIGVRMPNGQVVEAFTSVRVNRNAPP